MSEIIIGLIVGMAMGAWLLYTGIGMIANRLTAKIRHDFEQARNEHLDQLVIPAKVEMHDTVFFLYHNETDVFLAQGSNLNELRAVIRARWKQHKVKLVAGDAQVIALLKAQLDQSIDTQ